MGGHTGIEWTDAIRKDIARLIDLSKWRVIDSYLADAKRKYAKKNAGYDLDAFKDKSSLAIADAILACLQPSRTPALRDQELRQAVKTACDLLAERIYGSSARSPSHNARVILENSLRIQEGE